jgi:hypothetical protein
VERRRTGHQNCASGRPANFKLHPGCKRTASRLSFLITRNRKSGLLSRSMCIHGAWEWIPVRQKAGEHSSPFPRFPTPGFSRFSAMLLRVSMISPMESSGGSSAKHSSYRSRDKSHHLRRWAAYDRPCTLPRPQRSETNRNDGKCISWTPIHHASHPLSQGKYCAYT